MDFKIEDLFLGLVDIEGMGPADGRLAAFEQIVAAHSRGELPAPELMGWFSDSVKKLRAEHAGAISVARQKTAIANAFGYTKGSGRRARPEQEYYQIAQDVHRLKRERQCSDDYALSLYIEKNPDRVKSEGSTEWIGEIYKKYKEAVVHDYQEWQANMVVLENSVRRWILWLLQNRGE